MPYCPKCDMEFVEGITVCSDCGGPLLASREEAAAQDDVRQERERFMQEEAKKALAAELHGACQKCGMSPAAPSSPYVNRQQKYEDLKSSASAFLLVGGALTAVSVLCWSGILSLPIAASGRILTQSVLTAMGLVFLFIAFKTSQSAKQAAAGIEEENARTSSLIDWFCRTYTSAGLDEVILRSEPDLSAEELSLRRFDLISDYLVTHHDLPDPAYVEALCEEIYSRMYERD